MEGFTLLLLMFKALRSVNMYGECHQKEKKEEKFVGWADAGDCCGGGGGGGGAGEGVCTCSMVITYV